MSNEARFQLPIYNDDAKRVAREHLDKGDFRLSDLSVEMAKFGQKMRAETYLRHLEEALHIYGYGFVRGTPSVELAPLEAEAIGELFMRAVDRADFPLRHDRLDNNSRIRDAGYRYGATLVWQKYLFEFLDANDIGLVDQRDAAKTYPDLIDDCVYPYKPRKTRGQDATHEDVLTSPSASSSSSSTEPTRKAE